MSDKFTRILKDAVLILKPVIWISLHKLFSPYMGLCFLQFLQIKINKFWITENTSKLELMNDVYLE
jgi:hypothetical protein